MTLRRLPFRVHAVYDQPTIFHATHYKAGSQWVAEILKWCAYRRCVVPEHRSRHFVHGEVAQGFIYPTIYRTRYHFDLVMEAYPEIRWKAFFVMRDLRDTLVSLYFSLSSTHTDAFPEVRDSRSLLAGMTVEEGLMHLLMHDANELPCSRNIASVQESWLKSDVRVYRFEDLVDEPEQGFRELLKYCEIEVPEEQFLQVLENNSFEQLSGGRHRGEVDDSSHYRSGMAGSWREYFTPELVERFKEQHGQNLIQCGYETDLDWEL